MFTFRKCVGYLFFFSMLCVVHSLLFIPLLFFPSLNHAWLCVYSFIWFLSCNRAVYSVTHSSYLFWYSLLSLTVYCCCVCVYVSLSLNFHHSIKLLHGVHCIGTTCFMNLCLRDLPVCCVIASVLVENTNPTSTETQRFFFHDKILNYVCISIWFNFFGCPLQKKTKKNGC